jgi:ABC-2 type transport system permease protein
MNVFFQELRLRRKSQIWWAIAIIIFMVLSVVKFDTLAQDASMSEALLKQFPATVQAIFGMTGLSLTTLSGYFGVLFIYILVILSIHAGMLGAGLLADEERDRTTEFLLVKPRSRSAIITQKLLAGFLCLVVLWGVVVVTTLAATLSLSNTGEFMRDFWHFMIALGLTQVTVFFLGSFAAALTKNPKLPTRLVASIVFVSYLLFALVKLAPNLDVLKYLSLFCYFDAVKVINDGALQPLSIIVFSTLALVSLVGTYVFYRRRDVNV